MITDAQEIEIQYPNADDKQIQSLIDRSTRCTQDITYGCKDAPIHRGGKLDDNWDIELQHNSTETEISAFWENRENL